MNSHTSGGSAQRVLVVDDEKPWRDVLEYTLSEDGFEVLTAADGNEALDLAKDMRFDLVITDMIMPRKEGIETIMELRALTPGIKIIAMSGGVSGGTGDFLPLAKTLGAATVLRKPFGRQQFVDAVHAILPAARPLAVC
jgi:DNA-binding response OmpR family regulator